MTALLLSALVLLTCDPSTNQVDSYRIYVGTASSNYLSYQTFPNTNQFALTVTNVGRIYMAVSAVNSFGESDLSAELAVLMLVGDVQLGETVSGPWSNYFPITIPVQIDRPTVAVRTKLRVQ